MSDIFEAEPDAGLGNGGLGVDELHVMDSLATQGSGHGYSLCYELGVFAQDQNTANRSTLKSGASPVLASLSTAKLL